MRHRHPEHGCNPASTRMPRHTAPDGGSIDVPQADAKPIPSFQPKLLPAHRPSYGPPETRGANRQIGRPHGCPRSRLEVPDAG